MIKASGLLRLVAGAALGTSMAHAQCTPPPTGNGPDVIVGDVNGVSNYNTSGNLDAISLGTTSCNIGSAPLNWQQSTNLHSVVGQNLFKYKSSNFSGAGTNSYARFEQIGQSWLKHTFFAFQESLCCTNCVAENGSLYLGVHCSDPYTSGRNGSQSGLGPKWQGNAPTGVFTYPPANPTRTATNVDRRCEFLLSDCEASNGSTVRYYGECQYVTQDDANAGNMNNNCSNRELGMTTTGTFPAATASNLTLIGNSNRATLALQQWKAIDPTVTESELLINETSGQPKARILLSSKATDLGNGFWHYEFAICNQNSDVCIGTFAVPCPSNATVQNIGFHGVLYRDGDGIANMNIDGTDWPGAFSGGQVRWATTPFTTNNNGNAVRWGTTYNFRFDANVAPASPNGAATLTGWKVVSNYNVTAQVPGALGATCYANCDGSTSAPCLNILDFSCFLNEFALGSTYANCDNSTTPPVLNVLDFGCFLNRFSSGDTYANCDGSTQPPVLNVLDFGCFLNRFSSGCSSC